MEQLVIPGLIPDKKQYVPLVIAKLKKLQIKKVRLESLQYLLQQEIELLIPGHSDKVILIQDGRKRIEREIEALRMEINQVAKALEQLSYLEKKLVEYKFIQYKQEKTDDWIMQQLGVGKTKFYELQNSAMAILAESLGII